MEWAYFQIDTHGPQLGLDLINAEGERFFLYDQPLLAMWENSDSYVLVKLRNRDDRQAIGYHAGQVMGTLDRQEKEASLQLFFSPVDQDMGYDADKRTLKKVVSRQSYCLRVGDLEAVIKAFDVSRRHRLKFDEMKISGRDLALYAR